MSLRLFIVAAIVLVVFAIIATAATTGELFGVQALTWLAASLLAFYTDILVGGWGYSAGAWGGRERVARQA